MNKQYFVTFGSQLISGLLITWIGAGIGWLIGLAVSPVVSIVITSIVSLAASIVVTITGLEQNANEHPDKLTIRRLPLKINPLPLSLLILGIIVGSVRGIQARNEHWFGSDLSNEISKWSQIDPNINKDEILGILLKSKYPELLTTQGYAEDIKSEIAFWNNLGITTTVVVSRLFESNFPLSNSLKSTSQDSRATNSETNGKASMSSEANDKVGTYLFSVSSDACDAVMATIIMSDDPTELINALKASTDKSLQKLPEVIQDPDVLRELVEKVICSKE